MRPMPMLPASSPPSSAPRPVAFGPAPPPPTTLAAADRAGERRPGARSPRRLPPVPEPPANDGPRTPHWAEPLNRIARSLWQHSASVARSWLMDEHLVGAEFYRAQRMISGPTMQPVTFAPPAPCSPLHTPYGALAPITLGQAGGSEAECCITLKTVLELDEPVAVQHRQAVEVYEHRELLAYWRAFPNCIGETPTRMPRGTLSRVVVPPRLNKP